LPGIDFIGFGYDARFEDIQDALQVPIMDFSYTKEKAYFYPANRTVIYKVPDELLVRTVAFTEANAYIFQSVAELLEKSTTESGVNFAQEVQLSNSTAICVYNLDTATNMTTENCTTTSTFNNTKLFSSGSNINYIKETFSKSEKYIVQNVESSQLFGMVLDTRFLRHDVKDSMLELAQLFFTANPRLFFKFIETYGTHYVTSAIMGGLVTMQTTMDKTFTSNSDATTQSTNTLTTQEALAGATSTFQESLSGSSDFSLTSSKKKTQFSSSSDWRLSGGDSSLVNLLDTRQASTAIKLWKSSIASNPVPIQYRLRNIATLFDDPFLRTQMEAAVAIYLTFDTNDILRIGFNTTTGTFTAL